MTCIAIDIGGTSTRIAFSMSLDNLSLDNKVEFINTHDFERDYSRIKEEINKASNKIDGIGIGIPGDISEDKKIVYSTSWNHEWENKPFVDMFSKEFNCLVFMDNDATAAALGVAVYGEGKNEEFAYVTWGTGIGGAIVTKQNNKPISTKLDWDEYFSSWEDKCGGKKMEKNYGKTGDKLTGEDWTDLIKNFLSELKDFIKKIKPQTIIFGGGVSVKQKERLLALEGAVEEKIKISTLGENTGLYGAFALLKTKLN